MKNSRGIYLDYSATTPLSRHMKEYLIGILDNYGNPSSLYSVGKSAKQIIDNARESVARFINADPENIYFTCSGSASNTLAIKGFYQKNNCYILCSPIAHKSILECVKRYEYSSPLIVDNCGFIDLDNLKEQLSIATKLPLVVIDYVNSEIGTIQNVKDIISLVHYYKGIVYLDCTGSISTIPLDVETLDVDMCGFSAHKLGALKGCGVLYKKQDIALEPIVYGSQEDGLIGGTENVLGIASLGKAIENYDYSSVSDKNRDYVYNYISDNIPNSYLIGAPLKDRLKHNLYICFKGTEGEALMLLLDMDGIQVSTGSACNSGSLSPSNTLALIGISEDDIHSCIRLTFSGKETRDDLDYVCQKIKECVKRLRELRDKL